MIKLDEEVLKMLEKVPRGSRDNIMAMLLALHHNYRPSCIPIQDQRYASIAGLATRRAVLETVVPYDEGDSVPTVTYAHDKDSVEELSAMFRRINPSRVSQKSVLNRKLQILKQEAPALDMRTIVRAAELYIEIVDDPRYLLKCDNFLVKELEGEGGDLVYEYPILDYVRALEDKQKSMNKYKDQMM